MPKTDVKVFRDEKGLVEFNAWYKSLKKTNQKAYVKCQAAVIRLEREGFDLRRPAADLLRDGIWEYRFKIRKVHYRILYGFYAQNAVCISHGITKEDVVPDRDIDRAIAKLNLVKSNPQKYLADWEK
jgi:hypothetical protein